MDRRRGFTLVELLLSAAMLSTLALAGFAALGAGLRSGQAARRVGSMTAHAQRALCAMAEDIRSAVAHGDVRLTSLDADYEGMDTDTIDFIAPRTRRGDAEEGAGGLCEVGYYIDNDPSTPTQWLVRRQDDTVDEEPLEGGVPTPAGPFVAGLTLIFFDGEEWLAGWDDQERFPRAVRIGIVVVDPDGVADPAYYETTIALPAS